MEDKDLFGLMDLPAMTTAERKRMRRRAGEIPKGYAAPPGSGPEGETCKTCRHHIVKEYAKRYHKCDLTRQTGGPATDIRVNSPACKRWEKLETEPKTIRKDAGDA